MSLKKINHRSVVFRLLTHTTILLVLSVSVVSSVIYLLFARSLRQADQALLERLARSYTYTYEVRGAQSLKEEISPEVMVVITDNKKQPLFEHMPSFIDQDFEDEMEIRQLHQEVSQLPLKKGLVNILLLSGEENVDLWEQFVYRLRRWAAERELVSILPIIDNDLVEVLVQPMSEDHWIMVGRSSEYREERLVDIRYISFYVFIPFIFIGIILSYFLARSFLAPVKNLAQVIDEVKQGNLNARGHHRGVNDELDYLTSEFNSLMDRNEKLVQNLKGTVDNVAHDLRTPITRFRAGAEDVLINSPEDIQKLREALEEGLEGSQKTLKLLNAIMDVAEADTQIMSIKKVRLEVLGLIEHVVDMYSLVAEEKQIELKIDIPSGIWIEGDETRLMQAFGNLLDNALKYSPANTTITFSGKVIGEQVRIELADQGMGIDPADLERIWDKLYRGDKSRNTQGLGIGLSLVRAIIQVHQGRVWVESTLNYGSRFTVELPTCHSAVRQG